MAGSTPCRLCGVCLEILPIDRFYTVTSTCSHTPDVCFQCVRGKLEAEGTITPLNWKNLECPSRYCNKTLQHKDVRRFTSESVLQRYEEYTQRAVRASPNFRHCSNPNCRLGQDFITIAGTRHGHLFQCDICGHRYCTYHKMAYHEGETCWEYFIRLHPYPLIPPRPAPRSAPTSSLALASIAEGETQKRAAA
jgi:hypothetical protein